MSKKITLKTPQQIDAIREAGKRHRELILMIEEASRPGVQLLELEQIASNYLNQHNLKGSFKGFNGYPANLCLSNNDCLVHGIPDETILRKGDVLKIDIGVTYQGCIADAATTVIIGGDDTNPEGAKLVQATKRALDESIKHLIPFRNALKFSQTVYNTMRSRGFNVIKTLTGHGVGLDVHEGPAMYNYPEKSMKKVMLKPGMVLALEPITAIKSDHYTEGTNGRNLYTKHGDIGAQREYTIAVTQDGIEILAGVE